MTETPRAVTVERGYATAGLSGFWATPDREQSPDLRWPLCIDVYDAMRRQDAQVSSVLRAVTSPIERTRWSIDGAGCRDEVTQHVAGDLNLPIVGQGEPRPLRTKGRFTWGRHLREALLFLAFGHAYFEQTYYLDDNLLPHIRRLGYRPPETIAGFKVARDGGLVSIQQYGELRTIDLPIERLVAYVHQQEGGNWTGASLLRPAYKHWLIKDQLLRTQAQTIDRNGMGVPIYTNAPEGGEDGMTAGENMAKGIRSGDEAGGAIPNGAKLELTGVTGQLPDADVPIRYHDEQIARAVLAHFLNLGSQTGSWALGSTFADFFTLSLQAEAAALRDTANAHIVEDLVDLAFGPEEPAPRIVFDEIGSRGDAVVNAISVLVNAGVLRADEDLEQFVRTALGLPAARTPFPAPTPQEVPA